MADMEAQCGEALVPQATALTAPPVQEGAVCQPSTCRKRGPGLTLCMETAGARPAPSSPGPHSRCSVALVWLSRPRIGVLGSLLTACDAEIECTTLTGVPTFPFWHMVRQCSVPWMYFHVSEFLGKERTCGQAQ